MPLYEYVCRRCGFEFEKLQAVSEAGSAACPGCSSTEVGRKISLVVTRSKDSSGMSKPVAGTGGCASCTGSSCSSCH